MRNSQNQNNQHKESSSAVNAVSNGPIPKVNMNFAKCPPPNSIGIGAGGNDTSTIMPSRLNSSSSSSSSTKQIPYRSENSLHHSSSKQQPPNHLRPSNIYTTSGSSTSSNSTPNLSQMQLSPNQVVNAKTSPQQHQGNSRFSFNGRGGSGDAMQSPYSYNAPQQQQHRQTPLSAPPISNSNYKKQMSPYHNSNFMNNNNNATRHHQQTHQMSSSTRMPYNGNGNTYFTSGYRSGGESSGKFMPWQQQQQQLRSPSNLYATSAMKSPKSIAGVVNNRTSMELQSSTSRPMPYQRDAVDEVDSGNMWRQSLPIKANHQHTAVSSNYPLFNTPKGGFIRSDSLLATSNGDETYENIATNGKYGAIGIKTTESSQQQPSQIQTQWSGLQQTIGSRFDNNGFGSCSSSSTSSIGSNALKANDTLNPNDESARPHSGSFNGNFININVSNYFS
jgi:hypothetical protein